MTRRFIFSLFFLIATAAFADPHISRLVAVQQKDRISVSLSLDGAFEKNEIIRAIESGVPTGFTYYIELIRKRPNWLDQRAERIKIEVICTFNSVTNEYLVNYRRNRKLVRSEVFATFGAAQERMTRLDEPELFDARSRGHKFRVRARAEVIRSYVFYVVPWDVSTDWAETRIAKANGR